MGISLDYEEKGILKYLGKRSEAVNFKDITGYLNGKGYNLSEKEVEEKLENLMDLGYARSKTLGKGKNREEKFYLSRGIGAGVRKRKKLQGERLVWKRFRETC